MTCRTRHPGRLRIASWVVLAALAAAARPARADSHVLQAQVHVGTTSVREELLVPLAFTGPAFQVGARYAWQHRPHRLQADFDAGLAFLSNRHGHGAAHLPHGLALSYTHALAAVAGGAFALGGALRWQDEISYLWSWDDAHGYWLSTLTLGPVVHDARALWSGAVLESRGEFALLGLAARPPSYRMNKQDALNRPGYFFDRIGDGARLVSPLDLQALRLEVVARFRHADAPHGAGPGIGLGVQFSRMVDPEPYMRLAVVALFSYGWGL